MKKEYTHEERVEIGLALLDRLQLRGPNRGIDIDVNLSTTNTFDNPSMVTIMWVGNKEEEPRHKAWEFYSLLYNYLYGCDPETEQGEKGYEPL